MNPRKARTLIPLVTKELDLEKQLVSDLVYFYWQKVRKALTNMSASRVRVENLGTFNLRVKKTQGLIKALQEDAESADQNSFTGYKSYDNTMEKLEKLTRVMSELETEWEERREHYENRRNTENSLEQ